MCADETNDSVMINGRAEMLNHTSAVACGNGGISNNAATLNSPTLDPEVRFYLHCYHRSCGSYAILAINFPKN